MISAVKNNPVGSHLNGGDLAEFLISYNGDPGNAHEMHRAVYDRFLASGQTRNFLFCPMSVNGRQAIMIRGQASLLQTIAPDARLRRTYIPRMGDTASFMLRANPVYKRDGNKHQMPTFEDWDERRLLWLGRRGEERGFFIDNVTMEVESIFVKNQKNTPFFMNVVTYQGQLHVFDESRFAVAMGQGIGRAMTYGNGLLYCTEQ